MSWEREVILSLSAGKYSERVIFLFVHGWFPGK
jgi:hypothetical protein